jgi:hypothetical protein
MFQQWEEGECGAAVEPAGIEVERCISAKHQNKPSLNGMKSTNKKYRNLNKDRLENLRYIYTSWIKRPNAKRSRLSLHYSYETET